MPVAALAIGGIGSIIGGVVSSHAASSAANAQVDAANHAADLQHQDATQALDFNKLQYGNSLNMLSPYYNMGTASLGRLGFLMGLNPAQGTPPGVVNPNAPPAPVGAGNGSSPDLGDIAALRALRAGGGGPRPMQANAAMLPTAGNPFQNNPTLPGAPSSTTQFQMNPPITSGGTTVTDPTTGKVDTLRTPIPPGGYNVGGAAALSGGTSADTNPFPNGLGNIGTPTPQSTTASTNQGGTGQVPVTGGGNTLSLNPPINATGEAMFNGPTPPDSGGFGSLAQNFGEQWKAPTGVTEVNDPGYQFRINQGLQALQNSAAARGKLVSGDTAKGLNDYAQNSASGEFQNVYNRALNDYTTRYNAFNQDQNTQFNRFATLAGLGQTSAGQLANIGLGTAGQNSNILLTSGQQIGQDYQNAGAARGSGYVGSANAINGTINGISNLAQMYALLQQQQNG